MEEKRDELKSESSDTIQLEGGYDVTGMHTPTSLGTGNESHWQTHPGGNSEGPRRTKMEGKHELEEEEVETRLESQMSRHSRQYGIGNPSSNNVDQPAVKLVRFKTGDPENPYNWNMPKKLFVLSASVTSVMNSTMASSLPAGASAEFKSYFEIKNQSLLVLPTSIFLVGYILGPTLFGPLSETYGRRWVMIWAFSVFTIFTMACALAPSWTALIVFRFFAGIAASCPITVVGGTCADLWAGPTERGRAISVFMGATTFGPAFGPIISGYLAPVGWRWAFWADLIVVGVSWIPLAFASESYGPTILKKRAKRLRKETGNESIKAPIELEIKDLRHTVTIVLTRPVRMICTEALVFFSCLYLSLIYGIFYLFFQAFPIIFEGIYGFSAGEMGLAFLPIGVGACIAIPIYLWWDKMLLNARARSAPWVQKEEMRRLPLACVGGPLLAVSIFWLGWSARDGIHWVVPVLAGVPFGIAFMLIFMGLINYLIDAYEIFAASANGAASAARSIFGAVIPFAARPMYARLGVAWACSLLGFLSLLMCAVPFFFIRYGDRIRANSKFCQYLKQKKAEEEEAELNRVKTREEDNRAAGSCAA